MSNVRHRWTDEQTVRFFTLLYSRREWGNMLFPRHGHRPSNGQYAFKWQVERDVCVAALEEESDWIQDAIERRVVIKGPNGRLRACKHRWTSQTGHPVSSLLTKIRREMKPDKHGRNAYALAGASYDTREPADLSRDVRESFMSKFPYYFELRKLLFATQGYGPLGQNHTKRFNRPRAPAAAPPPAIPPAVPVPPAPLPSDTSAISPPPTAPPAAPDSDSEIEFISFSGPSTQPRKRGISLLSDSDVEFVSEGVYESGRKRRSVLTGTFVQSGAPEQGWDNVDLWTVDDDDTPRPRRATRQEVDYAEDESSLSASQRRHRANLERQRQKAERRRLAQELQQQRQQERLLELERYRITLDVPLPSPDGRIPMPTPRQPLYPLPSIALASSLDLFPQPIRNDLFHARTLADRRARFEHYVRAFRHLFLETTWAPPVPHFLRGWVIAADEHREPVIKDIIAIAQNTTALVKYSGTSPLIALPPHAHHALSIRKFYNSNKDVSDGDKTYQLPNHGRVTDVSGLSVLAVVDAALVRMMRA